MIQKNRLNQAPNTYIMHSGGGGGGAAVAVNAGLNNE